MADPAVGAEGNSVVRRQRIDQHAHHALLEDQAEGQQGEREEEVGGAGINADALPAGNLVVEPDTSRTPCNCMYWTSPRSPVRHQAAPLFQPFLPEQSAEPGLRTSARCPAADPNSRA